MPDSLPPIIADPWFYVVAVPAILLLGISKAGFGTGLGGLTVPMLALTMPVFQAAAILLPILCLMDLMTCWAYRRTWDGRNLAIMIPGAALGIALGAVSVSHLEDRHIALLVGIIAVLFGGRYFIGPVRLEPAQAHRGKGTFWSSVSGFTSFLAHAGSPPIGVYLLPQRLDKTLFVGTTALLFAAINYMKLLPYAWLGQFSGENLDTSLVLIWLVPFAIWLGLKVHRHISTGMFYRLCHGFMIALGIKLVGDGLSVWG
ncbi:MAG: sulfite exporter TauE/SafE family protein [Alphaproteobacteria bacterium]|nr:sulfite exporter TauE/SafE family protein [Alphaproteobacteria bacterium]